MHVEKRATILSFSEEGNKLHCWPGMVRKKKKDKSQLLL
jgi:hypothetical protein